MLKPFVIVFIGVLYIPCVRGSTGVILRRIENKNCILILGCRIQQIPARSKGECVFITSALNGTGGYYNSSAGLCHMCTPDSTFVEVNVDNEYYTKGR